LEKRSGIWPWYSFRELMVVVKPECGLTPKLSCEQDE
jgi:hypothetical protein